jgi:hypothetical protein
MLDDQSIVVLDLEAIDRVSAGAGGAIPEKVLGLVSSLAKHATTASNIAKVAELHPEIAARVVPGIESSLARVRLILNHPSFRRYTTADQLVSGARLMVDH